MHFDLIRLCQLNAARVELRSYIARICVLSVLADEIPQLGIPVKTTVQWFTSGSPHFVDKRYV